MREIKTPHVSNQMDFFITLRNKLLTYLNDEQIDLIYQAYLLAEKAHEGQFRRSGDPYITHPVAVAGILADLHMDHQSIMAALLHDVLEDTEVSKASLSKQFGEQTAELVDGVSKLTQINFETRAHRQAENFRKMLLAMVRDIRVILIKIADRLHNMRTLGNMPPKKRRRIAQETLEIYAPIANRLGMHAVRIEFEDLGFAALNPMRYRVLAAAVKKARINRKEIISTIKDALKKTLEQQSLIYFRIKGRQKHLYSIYQKMRTKRISFAEIMDVYGFRLTVDTVDTCYRVLGAVHSLYKPLPARFKDYIAIPKANGYQSLHTTLFGPYGIPIEIQIRTEPMDQIAENGIAAHWLYKSPDTAIGNAQIKAREWLSGLLDLQKSTGSSLEFIENVKIDLFPEEVYVFTPKGDILELTRGATPIDFAYAIHTDIGDTCVAAKVERRLAPLSMPLSNGQTVEIITSPNARPNPAWLNFVVTGKARSEIRHFLKTQQRSESILLGKELLDKSLHSFSSCLAVVEFHKTQILLEELHYKTEEDLYEAIGLGNQMSSVIAQRLIESQEENQYGEGDKISRHDNPLAITGTEGMVVTYADCCRPIPGDPIVGCLCPGLGITVHRDECEYVSKLRNQPEKLITMKWESGVQGEFKVDLKVDVLNQRWVLAQLATVVADTDANIDDIAVNQVDGRHFIVYLTIIVRNLEHLAEVLRRIRSIKIVSGVTRGK